MSKRSAYTLIELLLVLVIMVVAMSIAVPTYDSMITSRRIVHAVEAIRLELQRARLEAIKTGQAQVFRCQLGETQYVVQPWLKPSDSVEASAGATMVTALGQAIDTESTSSGVVASVADTSTSQKSLEEGVMFASADVLNDMRSLVEQSVGDTMQAAATGWSQPILFYPDGSSTTANLVIENARGRRYAVQVRGLTGEARVVEVPSAGG